MDVGMLLVFQNWFDNVSDEEVFTRELKMGVAAEQYGFDSVWSAEHHFDDYSMCPDNLQIMAWIAGQTSRIKLGTGAVILPWNDPLRVVEKVQMLDHMSGGRVLFGMGRGLAKMEYEGFRTDMNESRGRFDEAAEMIIRGLRNGYVENDGPYYKQPRVNVRPGPNGRSWDGRLFGVAMSPDSIPAVAHLGAQMMTFMQYDFPQHAEALNRWRALHREEHGTEPGPALIQDFVYCHEDPDEAKAIAHEHISRYFLSVIKHYDFAGSHWRETRGYEAYQAGADMIREAGMEAAASAYVEANVYGTPEQIVEKYAERREIGGDFMANVAFCFGGLPLERAEASQKLFGEKVVPELHKMTARTPAAV
ncbi:LLM class flavin-dependent oxidoreductase [Amycolatopsis sp. K13G38]|uniref:LLM class flavin-dependent oxidoreductase n=1 Tax=Amycolatopsis acididurans TaxID=2724524 RepID=A0ABX1IVW2_9PSEU|nr:LLM class flavin-dependent oxidoreductase [Amycolatopsis acididurans]NKQ51619.1 LLM class flavin-dependent oxidoreductase [Amycolatopsis acididurans]